MPYNQLIIRNMMAEEFGFAMITAGLRFMEGLEAVPIESRT